MATDYPDSVLLGYVVFYSLVWALILLCMNCCLKMRVMRNPSSRLARQIEGGAFNMQVYDYMVTLLGQMIVQPAFWLAAWLNRSKADPWWYGDQGQVELAGFLAYSAGYFLQDLATHYEGNSGLIVAHHVVSTAGCLALVQSSCWRGLLLTTAQFMELGSIAVSLGDLLYISRPLGHLICIFTSVLPVIWTIVGFIVSVPADSGRQLAWPAWFCAIGGILVALLRIKENWALFQSARQSSVTHQISHPEVTIVPLSTDSGRPSSFRRVSF
jgi:hypothetical protein